MQLGSFSKQQDDPTLARCWGRYTGCPFSRGSEYKVALLTFKVRSTSKPSCRWLLIQYREHGRNLRSTTTALCQPFTMTTFAKRTFRCSAPAVWNSLPKNVLSSDSVSVFKLRLKTFLFSQAFSSFSAHQHTAWPSASEVMTLRRYTNLFIVTIIIVINKLTKWSMCCGKILYWDASFFHNTIT